MLIYVLLVYTLISILVKYPLLKKRLNLLNSLKKYKKINIETKNFDFSKLEDLIKIFIILDANKNNSIATKKYSPETLAFADMSLRLKENIPLSETDIAIIEKERLFFIRNLNKAITFDYIFMAVYAIVTILSIKYIFL